jgi:hypothetical protein
MADITKPVTTATAYPSGRIVFRVLDREICTGLEGQYDALHSPTGLEYIVHIERDRATNTFTGWAMQKRQYGRRMPQNSEIWNFYGKEDFTTMTVTGTVQRNSARGTFIGSMNVRGTIGGQVALRFVSGGGELVLGNKVQQPLAKPAYMEA